MQFLLYQYLYYSGHHFGYLHSMKKEKKVRQYRSRQGRSDKQYKNSMIVLALSLSGLFLTLIIAFIFK